MIPRMTAEGELGWGSCHVWGWVVGLVASVSDSQKVCKGTKFSHTGPWVKAPSHQFFANFSNRIETGVGIESERREKERKGEREKDPDLRRTMTDWGPVVVATVLFVLLTPGLLCQIPGRGRVVEFGNMSTSGLSILVHAVIYFALVTIFVIAVSVHIYSGSG